ncbi:PREDICTED: zinc finger matrin-type protein 5-like, partial [Nestor notabilis]|uniref:zinc finger matrin-type protein 5-like n=1 Tax=Nestor notabilis TaxID=176057 RepID=UPI00052348F5
ESLQGNEQWVNGVKGLQQECLTASVSQPGEQRSKELRQEGADVPPGTIEDWLEKRAKRLTAAQSNSALPEKPAPFQYPPGWPPVQELPPSLLGVREEPMSGGAGGIARREHRAAPGRAANPNPGWNPR